MPEDRKRLGASPHVHDVREDRLLRFIAEQARNRTRTRERPSDHSLRRARRGLELVLPRRSGVRVRLTVGLRSQLLDLRVRGSRMRSPHGFSSPQCPAASYVHRPPTTAPTLEIASANQAASSPVGSPFDSLSYVHGPPNTQ